MRHTHRHDFEPLAAVLRRVLADIRATIAADAPEIETPHNPPDDDGRGRDRARTPMAHSRAGTNEGSTVTCL